MNNLFISSELKVSTSKGQYGLKNGHPSFFLLTDSAARLFEEPTLFLNTKFVESGSARSIHTWAAAAQALKSWFQFLQEIKVDWIDASRETRLTYRNAYEAAVSPQSGERYQAETIANRMLVIREFYKFSEENGWYQGSLGSNLGRADQETIIQRRLDSDPLAHTRSSSGRVQLRDKDLPKRSKRDVIRPLIPTDLRSLLHQAGPMASARGEDTRPARNRLFFDLAIHTCARLSELNSLTTLQFLSLHVGDQDLPLDFPLHVIGKGNKRGLLTCPGWLVRDAQHYIDGERADALKTGKILDKKATLKLFVGGINSTRPGAPITNRALELEMQKLCLAAGIVEIIARTNLETGEVIPTRVAKHSPHDLRHTGIVLIYHVERLMGNTEPWKKCQLKARHANLSTTIDTYLSHVETWDQSGGRSIDVLRAIGIKG